MSLFNVIKDTADVITKPIEVVAEVVKENLIEPTCELLKDSTGVETEKGD